MRTPDRILQQKLYLLLASCTYGAFHSLVLKWAALAMNLSAAILMKLHRCAAAQSQVQGHDLCLLYSADSALCKMHMVIISLLKLLCFLSDRRWNKSQLNVFKSLSKKTRRFNPSAKYLHVYFACNIFFNENTKFEWPSRMLFHIYLYSAFHNTYFRSTLTEIHDVNI